MDFAQNILDIPILDIYFCPFFENQNTFTTSKTANLCLYTCRDRFRGSSVENPYKDVGKKQGFSLSRLERNILFTLYSLLFIVVALDICLIILFSFSALLSPSPPSASITNLLYWSDRFDAGSL